VHVATEVARVVLARLAGQRGDVRARAEGRAWFVERDVPVRPNAEDLQVDSARGSDHLLVRGARRLEILGEPVRAMHPLGVEIHARDELTVDDVAVALGMLSWQADVLVEQEGARRGKAQPPGLMAPDELVVDGQRAAPRREP